jgi:hypothetical protein
MPSNIYNYYFGDDDSMPIASFYIDYIVNGEQGNPYQTIINTNIINTIKQTTNYFLTFEVENTKSWLKNVSSDTCKEDRCFYILEIPTKNFNAEPVSGGRVSGDPVEMHITKKLKDIIIRNPYDNNNIVRYYYIGFIYIKNINTYSDVRSEFIGKSFVKMINLFVAIKSICTYDMGKAGVCINKLIFVAKDSEDNFYQPMYERQASSQASSQQARIQGGSQTNDKESSRQEEDEKGSKKLTRKKNNAKNSRGKQYTKKTNIKQNMLYHQKGGNSLRIITNNNVFDLYREPIQKKVYINNTIIITGATGLGKTIRVPLYLLEILTLPGRDKQLRIRKINPIRVNTADWEDSNPSSIMIPEIDKDSMVLCALPKVTLVKAMNNTDHPILSSVADTGSPTQISECNMYNQNRIIGTLLAGDTSQKPGTYLNYITSGLLLKKMEFDPYLENFIVNHGDPIGIKKYKISCVIIDEAHERTSEIDLLLMCMKRLILVRPNFKLVIMSATINACIFKEYFYGEKVLYGPPDGVTCDKQNNDTFVQAHPNHYNSDVPILHIDTDVNKGWQLNPPLTPNQVEVGGGSAFTVDIYYLPDINQLCCNLVKCAQLILEIVKYELNIKVPLDYGLVYDTLYDATFKDVKGIEKHTISQILMTKNRDKNQDIIVFVPEKNTARILWSYLYMFNVHKYYDVMYYSKNDKFKLGKTGRLNMAADGDYQKFNDEQPNRINKETLIDLAPASNVIPAGSERIAMPMLILATNVVESSITFEHMKYVIDLGNNKQSDHHSNMNMDTLSIQCSNRASADQRKGRTGRKCNGICFRLFTKEMYDNLKSSKETDILHKRLDDLFVTLLEKYNFLNLDFIEAPSQNQVEVSLVRLEKLGYIYQGFNIYSRHDDEKYVNVSMINWISGMKNYLRYSTGNGQNVNTEYIEKDVVLLSIIYSTKQTDSSNLRADVIFIIFAMYMIKKVAGEQGMIGQNFTPPQDDPDRNYNFENYKSCALLWLYHHITNDAIKHPKEMHSEWIKYYHGATKLIGYILGGDPDTIAVEDPPLELSVSDTLIAIMNQKLQGIGQECGFGKINVLDSRGGYSTILFDPNIPYTPTRASSRYTYLRSHYSSVFNFLFLTKIN